MRRMFLISTCLLLNCSGCTMFQWLAPHQLWKLNRQPAISRDDAYFSIPAKPIPVEEANNDLESSSDELLHPF